MYLFSLIYKLTKKVNSQVQKWSIWEAIYSWVFKGNLPFFFSFPTRTETEEVTLMILSKTEKDP